MVDQMNVSAHWRAVERSEGKEEGSDCAEPSLEGPVGGLLGNRPLINQSP